MSIKESLYYLWKYVKSPSKIVVDICHYDHYQFAPLFSDKLYIKSLYKQRLGKKLNLKNPQTFREKLNWRKLYDRNPLYCILADKYEVKNYIMERFGSEHIIPTIGVYNNFEEIDFSTFPEKFVLKCTHDCSSIVICKDKNTFDKEEARRRINEALGANYYYRGRDWAYKSIKPRIIAENYITDGDSTDSLTDYKIFCFNGKADCVLVCIDRRINDTKFYMFDRKWKLTNYNYPSKNAPDGFTIPKPEKMDEMFELAEKLSTGINFVRVDLYQSDDKIYFGEYTFYPDGGIGLAFQLSTEGDRHLGELFKI